MAVLDSERKETSIFSLRLSRLETLPALRPSVHQVAGHNSQVEKASTENSTPVVEMLTYGLKQ